MEHETGGKGFAEELRAVGFRDGDELTHGPEPLRGSLHGLEPLADFDADVLRDVASPVSGDP